MITQSKIPVIGHNCLLDLNFMISHFHDILKPDYEFFKKTVHKYF